MYDGTDGSARGLGDENRAHCELLERGVSPGRPAADEGSEIVIQLRLALVAVAVLCAMGMVATVMLSRADAASSSCSMVKVDSGPALLSCHRGWFVGYPNMLKKGCRSVGVTSSSQLWVCPTKH